MEDLTPRNNGYSHRYLKHKLILFPQDQFTGRRKEIDLLLLSFEQMLSRGASLSSRGPRIFLIQGKEYSWSFFLNWTECAASRASVSQYEKGCPFVEVTFGKIGTPGILADRMQPQMSKDSIDLPALFSVDNLLWKPLRFSQVLILFHNYILIFILLILMWYEINEQTWGCQGDLAGQEFFFKTKGSFSS